MINARTIVLLLIGALLGHYLLGGLISSIPGLP